MFPLPGWFYCITSNTRWYVILVLALYATRLITHRVWLPLHPIPWTRNPSHSIYITLHRQFKGPYFCEKCLIYSCCHVSTLAMAMSRTETVTINDTNLFLWQISSRIFHMKWVVSKTLTAPLYPNMQTNIDIMYAFLCFLGIFNCDISIIISIYFYRPRDSNLTNRILLGYPTRSLLWG